MFSSPQNEGSNAKRLPVVFVVSQTSNRANGGVESITLIIERCQRIQPIVVTQTESPINRRWRNAGADVLIWPFHETTSIAPVEKGFQHRLQLTSSLLKTNWQMAQLIRRSGVRVVHCNDILAMRQTAWGAKIAGAQIVQNVRDIKPEEQTYGMFWQAGCRLTSHTIFLSAEMERDFLLRVPPLCKRKKSGVTSTSHIYSVVDTPSISCTDRQRARQALGIPPDRLAIGYVATFSEKKAQLPFIHNALEALTNGAPNSHVYFIGDFKPKTNSYAHACRDLLRRKGLDQNATLVGYDPHMTRWYSALDLIVVGSVTEGLARSMIESIATGVPVISFDVCSSREILDHWHCGVVVPQGNYTGLVREIKALADNDQRRHELGTNGIGAAKQLFQPQKIVRQYEDVYLSLAKNGRADSSRASTALPLQTIN